MVIRELHDYVVNDANCDSKATIAKTRNKYLSNISKA